MGGAHGGELISSDRHPIGPPRARDPLLPVPGRSQPSSALVHMALAAPSGHRLTTQSKIHEVPRFLRDNSQAL